MNYGRILIGVVTIAFFTLSSVALIGCAERSQESGKAEAKKVQSAPAVAGAEVPQSPGGKTMIIGFSSIGSVAGLGTVSVEAREIRSLDAPGSSRYGALIMVTASSALSSGGTDSSFIAYDEIDPLLRGIDSLTKVDKTITSFDNFQASYRTKGDFGIDTFNSRSGSIEATVSSGGSLRRSVYLKLSDLEKLKTLLVGAKAKLDTAKASVR